jgi:hypothetical protein
MPNVATAACKPFYIKKTFVSNSYRVGHDYHRKALL